MIKYSKFQTEIPKIELLPGTGGIILVFREIFQKKRTAHFFNVFNKHCTWGPDFRLIYQLL